MMVKMFMFLTIILKEDHHPGPRYDEEADDDDESVTIVLRRSIPLALCQAAVGAVPESLLKVPH